MAHPNIDARRAKVEALIQEGVQFTHAVKCALGAEFGCSYAAIHSDLIHFGTQDVAASIHVGATMRARIRLRDGLCCQYCGTTSPDAEYIIEHIIPAALGGVAKPYNLTIACQRCNATKRRTVWIPNNLDAITEGHPEWRARILSEGIRRALAAYKP